MTLTDTQYKFAEEHVGQTYETSEILRGPCVAWFDGGDDSAILLCVGPDGPFTIRQGLPVDDEELGRRQVENEAEHAERLAQDQAAAAERFGVELARFLGYDPEQDPAVVDKARAALAKAVESL